MRHVLFGTKRKINNVITFGRGIIIEWQELFPIVVACALWFPQFSGKRLQFWCDTKSVVAIINPGHSKASPHHGLCQILSTNLHEAPLFC